MLSFRLKKQTSKNVADTTFNEWDELDFSINYLDLGGLFDAQ